jgi:hypothetical protein
MLCNTCKEWGEKTTLLVNIQNDPARHCHGHDKPPAESKEKCWCEYTPEERGVQFSYPPRVNLNNDGYSFKTWAWRYCPVCGRKMRDCQ